jgi:hypothetical protein
MQIFFMRGIPHPWTDQSNRAGSERYRHHFFIATTARSIINLVRLHFASSDSEYIASHRTEQETAHMEEVNCTVPPCMNACALCRDTVQGPQMLSQLVGGSFARPTARPNWQLANGVLCLPEWLLPRLHLTMNSGNHVASISSALATDNRL